VFYVTTFLGFHILSHTYICWILIFTFFSQYLTINRLYIYIGSSLARPVLRHSEFDCQIFSAAGLLFFEYLDLVPQVPQLRVGALDLVPMKSRTGRTGRFRLEQVDLSPQSFVTKTLALAAMMMTAEHWQLPVFK
jgi:hypothetical protein